MTAETYFHTMVKLLKIAIVGFVCIGVCSLIFQLTNQLTKPSTVRVNDVAYNAQQYIFADGMHPVLLISGDRHTLNTHMIFLCQYQGIYVTCSPEIEPFERQ